MSDVSTVVFPVPRVPEMNTIWLDRSGEPEVPPPGPGVVILTALFAGFSATAGAALVLGVCYRLCRTALDRHRFAGWESAWAAVGPRWTSRH